MRESSGFIGINLIVSRASSLVIGLCRILSFQKLNWIWKWQLLKLVWRVTNPFADVSTKNSAMTTAEAHTITGSTVKERRTLDSLTVRWRKTAGFWKTCFLQWNQRWSCIAANSLNPDTILNTQHIRGPTRVVILILAAMNSGIGFWTMKHCY